MTKQIQCDIVHRHRQHRYEPIHVQKSEAFSEAVMYECVRTYRYTYIMYISIRYVLYVHYI